MEHSVRSMTSYCRLEEERGDWKLYLELRSVNSRFLDLHLRMPRWLNPVEEQIRRLVRERLGRGRVELTIRLEGESAPPPSVRCDLAFAKGCKEALESLASELDIDPGLDAASLVSLFRDVIVVEEQEYDTEAAWKALEPSLSRCLDTAVAMSLREGANLQSDLAGRLAFIEERLAEIEALFSQKSGELFSKLRDRLKRVIVDTPLDEGRILQEAALLADRLDITEELVRARSHIAQFRSLFSKGGGVGRTMDFLLQELFREVNTIASKSQDSAIAHFVVDIKGELEKMREQVQNIV